MVTLAEIFRWVIYSLRDLFYRFAARILRRDVLLAGSERRFRALLDSAPDAVVIVNRHGHIALVNAAAERMFGWDRSELIGQNVTELVPSRFRARHRQHQKEYLKHGEARPMGADGLDLVGRRKDGTEFPIEVSLSPLQTEEGVLVSSAIRDVTERRRMERELQRRAADLERSNAELEQFAYIASHDLSAPLRVVRGFVELLERRYGENLDDQGKEFIAMAMGGVDRMQRLIADLLAYSRVARTTTDPEPVDLSTTVGEVVANLADEIEERSVRVEIGELPTVAAEGTQMTQLFQNLVGNAVKFSRAEDPLVEVTAGREDGGWRFRVRDNGIGIDPKYSEKIFQMFQRLHSEDEFPGTGIGLSICKRIVEGYGGEIHAEQADGGGTVMSFNLPDGGGNGGG